MKWELSSTEKKSVVDPEDYSPDWAEALVYLIWKNSSELVFTIANIEISKTEKLSTE